jgi:transposase
MLDFATTSLERVKKAEKKEEKVGDSSLKGQKQTLRHEEARLRDERRQTRETRKLEDAVWREARLTDFVDEFQVTIQLAHYPPYHSKYNPIERVWGVLENHWNGSLLDTVETALYFAQTMTWNGKHPFVQLVEKAYHTGAKLTQKTMAELEKRFERLPDLERWCVRIAPVSASQQSMG